MNYPRAYTWKTTAFSGFLAGGGKKPMAALGKKIYSDGKPAKGGRRWVRGSGRSVATATPAEPLLLMASGATVGGSGTVYGKEKT